jgi:hypothetical protein
MGGSEEAGIFYIGEVAFSRLSYETRSTSPVGKVETRIYRGRYLILICHLWFPELGLSNGEAAFR